MFQTELDRGHDRYVRLLKISRDIIVASKRFIFSIHCFSRCMQNICINICFSPFITYRIAHNANYVLFNSSD